MTNATGVPMSPVQGAEIPLAKVPGGVSILKGSDFARQFYVDSPEEVLQQRVPGIILDDVQGNVFQTNIQFRGFESSPVDGEPQGLAVYQNGVRINESFGDVVNWDFLPQVAINNLAVVTNNPVYGLNALAGAITIDMKNGFNYHGVEVNATGGSFGRAQGTVQAGLQSGHWGIYFGGERIEDDGFRDFSDSQIKRLYGDLGFKNSTVDLHVNVTAADNVVGVTAAAPVQLLGLDWERTFTSPQITDNQVIMPTFNGTVNLNDNNSISGVAYFRNFKQRHIDGNISEGEDCTLNDGFAGICDDDGNPFFFAGTADPIPADTIPDDKPIGSIDHTAQDTDSWGGSLQEVNKAPIFGHQNQFLVGASYDKGDVDFNAGTDLGFFKPKFFVQSVGVSLGCQPPGPDCQPDDFLARDLNTINEYIGVYFSDTFNITDRLAATVGGRYNHATIEMHDLTGNLPGLNATNKFERFNPAAGLTYQLTSATSLYAGYSEANRAPVAAELSCDDPENPCLIESFLVSDPPGSLKQVVAKTWEAGIRGGKTEADGKTRLDWGLGLFRTETFDDILPAISESTGRGVFQNVGNTLRQGVEANLAYRTQRWFLYANYAFVDATFESSFILPSPSNPHATPCPVAQEAPADDADDEDDAADAADENLCVFVKPGDHMPGIPEHRFKLGADYWLTPKWKFGGDLIAVSDQFFFGDESNLNPELGGYTRVDLHTSYDVTPRFQIYALANNIFDRHYGVFGTFFDTELGNKAAAADPQLSDDFFTNARTITPAPPAVAYGGAKIRF
jgi:iron complex outermembrane recepter protein